MGVFGEGGRNRTRDQQIKSLLLYRLSYPFRNNLNTGRRSRCCANKIFRPCALSSGTCGYCRASLSRSVLFKTELSERNWELSAYLLTESKKKNGAFRPRDFSILNLKTQLSVRFPEGPP